MVFRTLKNIPVWKTGAQILSIWFFVGIGEELLFRGYFLEAFWRHFTHGTDRQRTMVAILFVSALFSIWHLPLRIIWLLTGELSLVLILVSQFVLFLLGLGYSYLFVRSDNILLTGLVYGLSDFPLVGMNSQIMPIILVDTIACMEITRLTRWKTLKASQQIG